MPGFGVAGSVVNTVTSSFTGSPSGSGVPEIWSSVSITRSSAQAGMGRTMSRATSTAVVNRRVVRVAGLANNAPPQDHVSGRAQHAEINSRVSVEHDKVGWHALVEGVRLAEPSPSAPRARAKRIVGGAELRERGDLSTDQPVRQVATRVGTGVDRYAGLPSRSKSLQAARVQGPDVLGVSRELVLSRSGVGLEIVELHHRGHQGDLSVSHERNGGIVNSGAVLDSVDAGGHQVCNGLLPKDVGRHPATQLVRPIDGRASHAGGPEGR